MFCLLILYGHGMLDLKFVHGGAEKRVGSNKVCPKRCTHLRPKLPRKLIEPRVLEKMVCLVADTFALVSNCHRK